MQAARSAYDEVMSCSISSAAQELRACGWCMLPLTAEQCDIIETANCCAAEFFALTLAAKRSHRHAAGPDNPGMRLSPREARMVATAGVGYLSTPAREWFHLATDPAALAKTRWPSKAFQQAMLHLLRLLESTCTAVLRALGEQSAIAGPHIAAIAADKQRWGDPSVMDLFHYTDMQGCSRAAEAPGQYAMGSHTDPGLLTITPCSAVAALELQDNTTGNWVDAENPEVSGVRGTRGSHRLLLFAGDALEDCAVGCVAVAHRVRRTAEKRLSLVYEMRRWENEQNPDTDGGSSAEQTLTNDISVNRAMRDSRSLLQHQLMPQPKHGSTPAECRVAKRRRRSDNSPENSSAAISTSNCNV